jgi:hypothetical protein
MFYLVSGYLALLYFLMVFKVISPLTMLGFLVFSGIAYLANTKPQCPNGDFCVFNGNDICKNCGKQRLRRRVKKD